MKSKLSIVAVLVFASGAVFADEIYPQPTVYSGPTKTRAEVLAELREAQKLGLITVGEGDVPSDPSAKSGPTKTRAQVVAEMREAQRLGLLHFGEGDAPIASPVQEKLIADAGRRAAEPAQFAGK